MVESEIMALMDDREKYNEAVMHTAPSDRVCQIAKEMDRLAAFAGDGKMFRMQVAGVLYAARCCGYVLSPNKLTVHRGDSDEAKAETRIR